MQRGYVQALVRQCDRNPAAALKNEDFRSIGSCSGRKPNISDGGQRHATRLSSSCRSDNCFSGPNLGGRCAVGRPQIRLPADQNCSCDCCLGSFHASRRAGDAHRKSRFQSRSAANPAPSGVNTPVRTASSRRLALENLRTHPVPYHLLSNAQRSPVGGLPSVASIGRTGFPVTGLISPLCAGLSWFAAVFRRLRHCRYDSNTSAG